LLVGIVGTLPLVAGCANDAAVATAQQTAASVDSAVKVADRSGTDWPRFLGPHETGVSDESGLLSEWPADGPPSVWTVDVGTGYSAPSVRGERLVLHHRVDDEEIIECLEAGSGTSVWKRAYPSQFTDPYGYNNGPRCTPLLTQTHCFTLGAEGKLTCVTLAEGNLVWQRDLKADFTIPDGFFGMGATPVLEGDKLIVLVGGQPDSGVVAFDSRTGKTLWEAVGKSTWDGAETGWTSGPQYEWTGEEMVASYSSPIVATIHDKRHLLCLMRQGLVSLNPETGAENFNYWFMSRAYESVNAARPVVVDDTILLSAAYRVGSALLRVNPDGQSYKEVWRDERNLLTHWSTAIHVDGHYYGFSGRHENEGELRCVSAETGEVVWQTNGWGKGIEGLTRGPAGEIIDVASGQEIPWPFYGRGSAILAEGHFIVLAERGTLALVKATAEGWQEVSRCTAPRMKYPSWTAPVLSRGLLYLRCEDALVCLDLRSGETSN
jgi:outer membrane protein assembly factor BamB